MMEREVTGQKTRSSSKSARKPAARKGLAIERFFTTPGVDPAEELAWEIRTARITGEDGEVVFEQKDIEVPKTWSMLATNVVASKYFRGQLGTPERERSVRQLVARVVDTIAALGAQGRLLRRARRTRQTFHAELTHLLYRQKMGFNSPVWFNVGVEEHPQCSACFINSVDDSMDSILEARQDRGDALQVRLRHRLEPLHASAPPRSCSPAAAPPPARSPSCGASTPSPASSSRGGKTRRAAKMVILNADHPDILEFIRCKADEEKKAWALIDAGYDGGFNVPGGAYDSVFFQNSNNSVRVTDDFMQAVRRGPRRGPTAPSRDGAGHGDVPGPRPVARDRRGRLAVRRPGHAVRHHHQRLAHLPEHGAHQRVATPAPSTCSSTTRPATWRR